MKIKVLIVFLIISQALHSQKYTISGYVEDLNTGERVIGAFVQDSISYKVSQTNNYGFYSIKNVSDKIALQATFAGYRTGMQYISLTHDSLLALKIDMTKELKEVVIESSPYTRKVNSPLGLTLIPVKSLTSMPALGETDLLKAIQNQPGIKGGMEGSSGIFVRGGGGGENLFMLDDVPIYNVSHLYGFFSAFNSSAVKDLKLLKGCFPARYGGRTSSVIDVRSLDGNNKSVKGEASVGLISAKATLEGPLWGKKTTFMVSGRRSYFDLFKQPLKSIGVLGKKFPVYYFYDINARLTHTFSQKDKVYLSLYKGKDDIQDTNESTETNGSTDKITETRNESSGWGNIIGSLRWNHAFGNSLFVNTTVAYSNYDFFTANNYSSIDDRTDLNQLVKKSFTANYASRIKDLIVKTDFDYSLSNNHMLKFGMGNTLHTFNPGKSEFSMEDQEIKQKTDTSFTNDIIEANEPWLYLEDEFRVSQKLTLNAGVRYTGFVSGNHQTFNFEPRLSANYLILPMLAIKAGYSRMVQYVHLLNTSGLTMPTDIWVPALKGLYPLTSDQVNIGFAYDWDKKAFFTIEVYQKWLTHTTDFRDGTSLSTDLSPWYNKTVQGKGKAQGLEISIEKQQGRLKGSIAYTLSTADRKYNEINYGKSFPFKYDRRHDFSVSTNYQLSEKWDVSALWVYGSGYPVTLPVEKYLPALGLYNLSTAYGFEIDYYPSRNNYRLTAYHRLDLGIHYKTHNHLGDHTVSFDIFNAYNRKNPVNAYFSGLWVKSLTYTNLLPLIPSITYTLKF